MERVLRSGNTAYIISRNQDYDRKVLSWLESVTKVASPGSGGSYKFVEYDDYRPIMVLAGLVNVLEGRRNADFRGETTVCYLCGICMCCCDCGKNL